MLDAVLRQHRPLDDQFDGAGANAGFAGLPDRDRALSRALVATALRRLGTLRHLIGLFLEHGLPAQARRVETVLLIGAAQILFLDVPDHAAVDLSVRLARADRDAVHFAGLVNAVLRRVAREGTERLATLDAANLDTPEWLLTRWTRTYGETTARAIASANGKEPALDLTVKNDPESVAAQLGGRVLPTGTCAPSRTASSPRCRASPKAGGGCRMQRRRFRHAFLATSPACASPICRRAWRQNRATHQGGRRRHRGRSRAGAA